MSLDGVGSSEVKDIPGVGYSWKDPWGRNARIWLDARRVAVCGGRTEVRDAVIGGDDGRLV